ncbi:MAG TPA: tetratricopeptide repeat protein [Candidatus Brocadiia bacterium]|nr:tetratricopeptide repeat protein [Candidatus Brocadiia bacterium]
MLRLFAAPIEAAPGRLDANSVVILLLVWAAILCLPPGILLVNAARHFPSRAYCVLDNAEAIHTASLAWSVASGRGYSAGTIDPALLDRFPSPENQPEVLRQPLYPVMVAAAFKSASMIRGNYPRDVVPIAVSCAFWLAAAWLTYFAVLRVGNWRSAAFALILCLSNRFFIASALGGSDLPFIACIIAGLLLLLPLRGDGPGRRIAGFALTGLLTGAAILTRPAVGLPLLLATAYLFATARQITKKEALGFPVGITAALLPWLIWNQVRIGLWTYASIAAGKGIDVCLGNLGIRDGGGIASSLALLFSSEGKELLGIISLRAAAAAWMLVSGCGIAAAVLFAGYLAIPGKSRRLEPGVLAISAIASLAVVSITGIGLLLPAAFMPAFCAGGAMGLESTRRRLLKVVLRRKKTPRRAASAQETAQERSAGRVKHRRKRKGNSAELLTWFKRILELFTWRSRAKVGRSRLATSVNWGLPCLLIIAVVPPMLEPTQAMSALILNLDSELSKLKDVRAGEGILISNVPHAIAWRGLRTTIQMPGSVAAAADAVRQVESLGGKVAGAFVAVNPDLFRALAIFPGEDDAAVIEDMVAVSSGKYSAAQVVLADRLSKRASFNMAVQGRAAYAFIPRSVLVPEDAEFMCAARAVSNSVISSASRSLRRAGIMLRRPDPLWLIGGHPDVSRSRPLILPWMGIACEVAARRGAREIALGGAFLGNAFFPESEEFRLRLSQLLIENCRYAEAEKLLNERKTSPANAAIQRMMLMEIHAMTGKRFLAEEAATAFASSSPDPPGLAMRIADVCVRIGFLDQAQSIVGRLAQRHPDVPALYIRSVTLAADVLAKSGNYDQAIRAVEEALARSKGAMPLLISLASAKLGAGRLAEAAQACAELIKTDAQLPSAFVIMAECEAQRKNLPEAVEICRKGLERYPGDLYLMNSWAYYQTLQGQRLDDAVKIATEVVRKHPCEVQFRDTLAWALSATGKHEDALKVVEPMKQAVWLDPLVCYHYGAILARSGRQREALPYLRSARSKASESAYWLKDADAVIAECESGRRE